ncbi:hypothetical protein P170DRAFT_469643 [Aspergillus steynii IBT 23096]|uniref:Uncharacterized protein n=1 Tax=Aspergillus steynii IBT 23096 TaxID=1392250 RepID=A0A2I2GMV9_9EURO|nr:uncharacterized protein P170DRAFT_469643 [Aspergillus steynii IBT 23096]PLB54179.1 hypothetical protein P170DRAFT_469643 [Aspergillus steynii IBT 23096]
MHYPKAILVAAAALFASALAEDVQIAYTIGDTYMTQNIPIDVYTPLTQAGEMTSLQNNGRCLLFVNGASSPIADVMKGSHILNPSMQVGGIVCHDPSSS